MINIIKNKRSKRSDAGWNGMHKNDLNPFLFILFLSLLFVLYPDCSKQRGFPPADFYAVIMTDTHVSNDENKDRRIESFIDQINEERPLKIDLLFHLGDVVSSVWDQYEKENSEIPFHRLGKADSIFDNLIVPYYFTMGNHDYKIDGDRDSDTYFPEEEILQMEKHWKDVTGFDPFYSVSYNGWKFIILNSMRGRYLHRHFDEAQIDWFEEELNDSLPTVLCSHYPLKTDHLRIWCKPKDLITQKKEPRFYSLLARYEDQIKAIFTGHGHMWVRDRLFGNMPVLEVDSFEESGGFYLAGFCDDRIAIKKAFPVRSNYE